MTAESGESTGGGAPTLASVQARVEAFWTETDLPRRAIAGRSDGPPFRFTEGPPTANGAPHIGHVVPRALKDVVLRYRRMRGDRILTPMGGWDCHGLPVELEIEKRHGLRSKRDIERYGVEKFCDECRASALEVVSVWREMSRRMAYWLDYDRAYLTMSAPYIESVWWSLKTLFDRGLLEKGYYSLPYCPRCETPLSSHEVAQGYKETTDPSVTVRLRLESSGDATPRYLLIWTTTPWTLPANLLVAAREDLTYATVRAEDGAEYVLAEAAVPRYFPPGHGSRVVARASGRELAGQRYRPPFGSAGEGPGRYRVVLDDSVDDREGTGLVHIAPSFGPDDQRIGEREGVGFFDPLDSRGVFTERVPEVAGRSFKAADPILLERLKRSGALVRSDRLRHTYPFCWRCGTALIYRGIDSWFVRTSRRTESLVANNATVRWVPEHLREGRFGNFLTEAKDWALSRNRYWGTPLPIWRCASGHTVCVGSFAELAERTRTPLPAGFDPHRVAVDALGFPCPTCSAPMHREPYTIDGWYDSGSAPFAQYHYPFEPGPFEPERPLDFVAEGLDQTRGWFYTLLVLSTLLFDRPAYRVSLTNGLVLDESGQKMSKSLGNVTEPLRLLASAGGDAVRWSFFLLDYTEPMRLSETGVRQAAQRTLGTLLNAFVFYRENARADGLESARRAPRPTGALDRWLLSRLDSTVDAVTRALDSFDPRRGALALHAFVQDLSTWYLRRSRPRFWGEAGPAERRSANDTLSFALLTLSRLFAPFAPFLGEYLYQELDGGAFADPSRSVHLEAWPSSPGAADSELERAMEDLRAWVEVGRELRQRAGVKARVPLERFVVRTPAAVAAESLGEPGLELIADELNVTEARFEREDSADPYPKTDYVTRELPSNGRAVLSRTPTPELAREGLVRETLRRLQQARKDRGLEYTDRIRLELWASDSLYAALDSARDRLAERLLADSLELRRGPAPDEVDLRVWEIGDDVKLVARLGPTARAAVPVPPG
jgi:isoleucyl-tRNA synthetase